MDVPILAVPSREDIPELSPVTTRLADARRLFTDQPGITPLVDALAARLRPYRASAIVECDVHSKAVSSKRSR
jgi:hypothetical protein